MAAVADHILRPSAAVLAPAGLKMNADTHTYTLRGAVVPGVTRLLGPVSDYSGIPARILVAAQERGTHTHMACEFDDQGILDESSVSAEVRPRLSAWRRFCADHGAKWQHIEALLYSRLFGFAGTVDRIGEVDGHLAIVDIKTGARRMRSWGLQLAAYRIAAELPDARRYAVRLLGDGTYRMDEFANPAEDAVFRALLLVNTWTWSNET